VYIAILGTAVIAGLIWGYGQLNNSSLPKSKKNKKNKSPKK
jgi:hypothetical protein